MERKSLPHVPWELIEVMLKMYMELPLEEPTALPRSCFTRRLTVRTLCHRAFALIHPRPVIILKSFAIGKLFTEPIHDEDDPYLRGFRHLYEMASIFIFVPSCLDNSALRFSVKEQAGALLQADFAVKCSIRDFIFNSVLGNSNPNIQDVLQGLNTQGMMAESFSMEETDSRVSKAMIVKCHLTFEFATKEELN